MADELKRVGLVFKQDGAVDFKKTLQEVNLELNKNYNQFKLTQAQWDKSTTSTQKLRAEQDYLRNAYEIQADKVNTLKMQLSDLENAEEKNTSAIKKKRNELTNAELKLETYNKRIKEIESQLHNTGKRIEEFGTRVEKFGDGIEKTGKKVSVFSTAIGSAFIASAKSAIDFESAFTGVEKTVDGTEEQMTELKQGIRDMSKELPSSTKEISAVAEAAGQLGIKTEDILDFTKVMIDLGNSTNLSADEAASSLAKFANVTKMSSKDYKKLGSTIVALGNNFATTESDIVSMATRLAATGELTGLSQSQILSLATAMSSVGIEAEAGGSAMSKLLKKIQVSTETGGKDLNKFAKIAGMSTKDFKKAFEKDAVKALSAFISGLNDTKKNGKSAVAVLDEMGIKEVRLSNTILSLANASSVMNNAVKLGNEAWENNSDLTNEANKRYGTLESKIQIAINRIKDLGLTFGEKLKPVIEKIIVKVEDLTKWISNLTDEQIEWILKIGAAVVALGPLLTIFGKITSVVGGVIKGIGIFTQAIGVMNGTIVSSSLVVNGLAGVFSKITGPIGLACAGIAVAVAGIALAVKSTDERIRGSFKETIKSIEEQKNSWEELKKSREKSLDENSDEIVKNEMLLEELDKIVDRNGKIKKGYEARAKYIVGELSNSLGAEIKLNGNIIEQYDKVKSKINELIMSKKAEALMNAYQGEYTQALKKQQEATQNLIDLREKFNETSKKLISSSGVERVELKQTLNALAKNIGEQTDLIGEYGYTVENYEKLQTASVSGSAKEIEKAVKQMGISWSKAKSDNEKSLAQQLTNESKYVKGVKEALKEAENSNDLYQQKILKAEQENGEKRIKELQDNILKQTSTIKEMSEEETEAWKELATDNFDVYKKTLAQMPTETQKKIEEITGVLSHNSLIIADSTKTLANGATNKYNKYFNIEDITQTKINKSSNVLKNDTKVAKEAGKLADKAEKKVQSNDSTSWGKDMVVGLGTGIRNKGNSNWFTNILSGLAGKISSYLHFSRPDVGPLKDYEKWMPDMVKGLGKSLDKSSPNLINSVKNMTDQMSNELQSVGYPSSSKISSQELSEFDYEKMAQSFTKALTNCKFTLDEEGFARIIKDELYKVV